MEPTFEIRERCGLSTSTRNVIRSIWPNQLPNMNPETLARLVFCYENNPERCDGIVSGAQDAIGICVPGLSSHYYDNKFWPETIEICNEVVSETVPNSENTAKYKEVFKKYKAIQKALEPIYNGE